MIQMPGNRIRCAVSPESVPIRKEVRLIVISVSSSFTVLIAAFKKVETVIPARMIVVRELSESDASKKIASVVSSAPRNAKTGSAAEFAGKKIMASMTAKPEPELTPIVFGLARELFITPCRITPAQASPTPAKSPPKTRGMRTVFNRTQAVEEVSFAVRTAQISEKLRFTLPNRIPEQTETNKSRIKSIMIKKLRFLFMENSLF